MNESAQQANTYFLDTSSEAEMRRLLIQDQQVTTHIGLFPPDFDRSRRPLRILDLACGPGGWAIAVALQCPHSLVHAVDSNEAMITFAREQALAQEREQVHFQVMNILHLPLAFPASSFDLIQARFIGGFLSNDGWVPLLEDCYRLLDERGVIRLSEWGPFLCVNTPAVDRLHQLAAQALWQVGQNFSPVTYAYGPTLPFHLRHVGFQQVHSYTYTLDWSRGSALHEGMKLNQKMAFRNVEPFLCKAGLITAERFAALAQQADQELDTPDLLGWSYLISAWGTRHQ